MLIHKYQLNDQKKSEKYMIIKGTMMILIQGNIYIQKYHRITTNNQFQATASAGCVCACTFHNFVQMWSRSTAGGFEPLAKKGERNWGGSGCEYECEQLPRGRKFHSFFIISFFLFFPFGVGRGYTLHRKRWSQLSRELLNTGTFYKRKHSAACVGVRGWGGLW